MGFFCIDENLPINRKSNLLSYTNIIHIIRIALEQCAKTQYSLYIRRFAISLYNHSFCCVTIKEKFSHSKVKLS